MGYLQVFSETLDIMCLLLSFNMHLTFVVIRAFLLLCTALQNFAPGVVLSKAESTKPDRS